MMEKKRGVSEDTALVWDKERAEQLQSLENVSTMRQGYFVWYIPGLHKCNPQVFLQFMCS